MPVYFPGGGLPAGVKPLGYTTTSALGVVKARAGGVEINLTPSSMPRVMRPTALSFLKDVDSPVNPEYEAVIDGIYHMRTPGGTSYPTRYHPIAPQLLPKTIPMFVDSEDWMKVGSITIDFVDSTKTAGWRWLLSANSQLAYFGTGRRCFLLTADNYTSKIGSPDVTTTNVAFVRMKVAGRTTASHAHVAFSLFGNYPKPSNGRGSISFGFDDGIASAYTVGATLLEKYGFRGYFNIIRDRVGTPGYMTDYQVRDLVARGHELYCHGPRNMDAGGDLSKYATEVDIEADIAWNLEYVLSVGGNPDGYITPRGIGMSPAGDPKINNVLRRLGFKWSRSTVALGYPQYTAFQRELLDTSNAFDIPVIGHSYKGGGDMTLAEATNVANIGAVIDDVTAYQLDGTLCNHELKTNPSVATDMLPADYETLLIKTATHVSQGKLDWMLPSTQIAANIRGPVPIF